MNISDIELSKKINLKYVIGRQWLEQQTNKGRIDNIIWIAIPHLIDALDLVYPMKWEFQIETKTINCKIKMNINIIIKFDIIEISNSTGLKKVLQDLYVKLPIRVNNNHIDIDSLQGTRGKLNFFERKAKYLHSHLSSLNASQHQDFKNFCQGSGGLPEALSMVNAGFTNNLFKLLLFQIDTYVRWESLEGGPHIRMKGVVPYNIERKLNIESSDLEILFKTVDDHICTNDFDIIIEDGNYIIENKNIEQRLVSQLSKKFLVTKSSNGTEYPIIGTTVAHKFKKLYTNIIWNNEELKQIEFVDAISANDTKYISSIVLKIIKEYLQSKLVKKILEYADTE